MEIETPIRPAPLRVLDKAQLVRILDAANARMGFVPIPGATAEKVREMMLAEGVNPNDNEFSRGIVEAREE